jgi:SAM-dependent methyltransferase
MNPAFWDQRYGGEAYQYGTTPNTFVVDCSAHVPPGPVLCLGEGEGRNAVFLAGRGHAVTAVDQSAVGLAKATQLASQRGATIRTTTADLAGFEIVPGSWAGIVATFVHLPPDLRRTVHRRVVAGLLPGGVYILEAYTPDQIRHRTGGPVDFPELLMTLTALQEELTGLELVIGREIEREVREGARHTGRGAVVQVLARRPE